MSVSIPRIRINPRFLPSRMPIALIRPKLHTMRTGSLKLLILLVSISCPAMAQVGKLYPVDEGPKDPSFQAFRDKLIEAAKNRDAKFILSILDPNITSSFGGNGGVKEFKETWKLD